jgi:hypothetical protein
VDGVLHAVCVSPSACGAGGGRKRTAASADGPEGHRALTGGTADHLAPFPEDLHQKRAARGGAIKAMLKESLMPTAFDSER